MSAISPTYGQCVACGAIEVALRKGARHPRLLRHRRIAELSGRLWLRGVLVSAVHPICPQCKRELRRWPLKRGSVCSPKNWAYCIREWWT